MLFLMIYRWATLQNFYPQSLSPCEPHQAKHCLVSFCYIQVEWFLPLKSSQFLRKLFNFQKHQTTVHFNQARGNKKNWRTTTAVLERGDSNGLFHGVNNSGRRAWPLPSSKGWNVLQGFIARNEALQCA